MKPVYNQNIKSRKIVGQYKNGNYNVYIMDDGSKIRYTEDDVFEPSFPESIDLHWTAKCSMGCPFCYANCLPTGKHWNMDANQNWLTSLHPYTELAINGNDWDDIPGKDAFLIQMKKQRVFVNATFHMEQYLKLSNQLKSEQDEGLLHGIGVSINKIYTESEINTLKQCNNVVVHVVAGLFNEEIFNSLKDKGLKLLILGYKHVGRGMLYKELADDVEYNIWLSDNLQDVFNSFNVCSFDNLSLEQLDVKHKIPREKWEHNYMGDDGQFTMFIDAVNMEFAKNSIQDNNYKYPYNIQELLYSNINTLFNYIRNLNNSEVDKLDIE